MGTIDRDTIVSNPIFINLELCFTMLVGCGFMFSPCNSEGDPGFFWGGEAPSRNDVAKGWHKQSFCNTYYIRKLQVIAGEGVRIPCTCSSPRSTPVTGSQTQPVCWRISRQLFAKTKSLLSFNILPFVRLQHVLEFVTNTHLGCGSVWQWFKECQIGATKFQML